MMRQPLLGSPFLSTSVLADRYEVRSRIGRGGMAEVYSAFDRTLSRVVALKILHQGLALDHRAVARFRREARAVAALAHPNIVSIYDVGVDGETPFMVMELVDGEPLSTVIWREAPLPVERAVHIATAVADALSYAHDRGIVHRDVKPGNVMVCPDGHVKVLDFGIARAMHWTPLTEGGPVQGTAEYVSPEQVRGMTLDGRSDLYSLGIVLYEMLAGQPPFHADTAVSVGFQHVEQQPRPLRLARPGIPPSLEAVVMRCLVKKPRRRYQSAERLSADLCAVTGRQQDDTPVGAPDPPLVARTPPLIDPETAVLPPARVARAAGRSRRRKRFVALAAVVVLAVGGAGALFVLRSSPPAIAAAPRPPVLHGPTALGARGGCDGFLKGKVTLSWVPSTSSFADGYVVYRATSPDGPFEKIDLLSGRVTTTYVDGAVNTHTAFFYMVRATAGSRISPAAALARAQTPLLCF